MEGKIKSDSLICKLGLTLIGPNLFEEIEFIHTVFAHTNLTCKTLDPFYKSQQWPFQDLTQSSLSRIIIIQIIGSLALSYESLAIYLIVEKLVLQTASKACLTCPVSLEVKVPPLMTSVCTPLFPLVCSLIGSS